MSATRISCAAAWLASLLACSGAPSPPKPQVSHVASDPASDAASQTQLIVLAGNFLSAQGGCGKQDGSGCDLYSVRFDMQRGRLLSVQRLTDTPGVTEHFPSVDRHQQVVAFTQNRDRRNIALRALSLSTLEIATLTEDGRYPSFSEASDELAFSTRERSVMLGRYASGRLEEVRRLAQGRDPQFSPDGSQLVYHVRPDGDETQPAVLTLSSGQPDLLGPVAHCAHATFSQDGQQVYCGKSARLQAYSQIGDRWHPAVAPSPQEPERFSACRVTSHSYPEFCPGGRHLVVSVGCHDRGETRYTQVLLLDTVHNTFIDLHGQIEAHLGVSGKASRSADCAG